MNVLLAEFIGTFFLVFMGCGAVIVNDITGALGHLGVAFTFGLVILLMVYTFGSISGAHFNPAVSVAMLAAGKLPLGKFFLYLVSQILGAFAAAFVLRFLFPIHPHLGTTMAQAGILNSFVLEGIMTFALVYVILSVVNSDTDKSLVSGLMIGGTIALDALVGGPLTGASMNPARSLAPAVVSGQLNDLWVYLAAPVLGGLAALGVFLVVKRLGQNAKA